MQSEILLQGISFADLQDAIQTIVSNEVQRAVVTLTPPTDNTPELLTRKQPAKSYGGSLPTFNEWTKNGIIPAKRIGGSVRYEKEAVLNSLNDMKTLKYRRA